MWSPQSIRQDSPKARKHKNLWACLIPAEHAAFLHRTIPKACKVLTESNHFIRHFKIFCYYSPERKGRKKKISNGHYNKQLRRWQKMLCCGNKAQHKANAHREVNTTSQLKLFWKRPLGPAPCPACRDNTPHFSCTGYISTLLLSSMEEPFCHSCSRQI